MKKLEDFLSIGSMFVRNLSICYLSKFLKNNIQVKEECLEIIPRAKNVRLSLLDRLN